MFGPEIIAPWNRYPDASSSTELVERLPREAQAQVQNFLATSSVQE